MKPTVLLSILLLVSISSSSILVLAQNLRVSAFNIQVFGVAKMDDPAVVQILTQVLNRYDVTLIQEIRDSSDTAIHELMDGVNAYANQNGLPTYQMVLGIRLGRTSSKEQYAYFYRPSELTVVRSYQWDADQSENIFERPPLSVHFRSTNSVGEFGIMGIHVKPDDAVAEIDALVDVYDGMVSMWNLPHFVITGDFNAGCSYVSAADWAIIRLRSQTRFQWVIGDNVDTTVSNSDCPYDRFVLVGSRTQGSYVAGSAIPFLFDAAYGLTQTEALDVSDHYPVELSFR